MISVGTTQLSVDGWLSGPNRDHFRTEIFVVFNSIHLAPYPCEMSQWPIAAFPAPSKHPYVIILISSIINSLANNWSTNQRPSNAPWSMYLLMHTANHSKFQCRGHLCSHFSPMPPPNATQLLFCQATHDGHDTFPKWYGFVSFTHVPHAFVDVARSKTARTY